MELSGQYAEVIRAFIPKYESLIDSIEQLQAGLGSQKLTHEQMMTFRYHVRKEQLFELDRFLERTKIMVKIGSQYKFDDKKDDRTKLGGEFVLALGSVRENPARVPGDIMVLCYKLINTESGCIIASAKQDDMTTDGIHASKKENDEGIDVEGAAALLKSSLVSARETLDLMREELKRFEICKSASGEWMTAMAASAGGWKRREKPKDPPMIPGGWKRYVSVTLVCFVMMIYLAVTEEDPLYNLPLPQAIVFAVIASLLMPLLAACAVVVGFFGAAVFFLCSFGMWFSQDESARRFFMDGLKCVGAMVGGVALSAAFIGLRGAAALSALGIAQVAVLGVFKMAVAKIAEWAAEGWGRGGKRNG